MTSYRILKPASRRGSETIIRSGNFLNAIMFIPPVFVFVVTFAAFSFELVDQLLVVDVAVIASVVLSFVAAFGVIDGGRNMLEMRPDVHPDELSRRLRPFVLLACSRLPDDRWPVRVVLMEPDHLILLARDGVIAETRPICAATRPRLPPHETPCKHEIDDIVDVLGRRGIRIRAEPKVAGGFVGVWVAGFATAAHAFLKLSRTDVENSLAALNMEDQRVVIEYDRPSHHEMAKISRNVDNFSPNPLPDANNAGPN